MTLQLMYEALCCWTFSHVSKTEPSFRVAGVRKKRTFHQKGIRNAFRVAGVGQNRHTIAIPLCSMCPHARRYRALRRCFCFFLCCLFVLFLFSEFCLGFPKCFLERLVLRSSKNEVGHVSASGFASGL